MAGAPAVSDAAAAAAGEGFLTIRNGRFHKDGKPFSIRASCCDPAVGHWFKFNGPWLETGIGHCKAYGFNAIRTWVPGTGPGEWEATYRRYRQDRGTFFREFDSVFVKQCKAQGVYLILTLTRLPDAAAPGEKYDVDSGAYRAWKRFAQDFCGHYRNEPRILFWEVANEYRGDPGKLEETRRFYERAASDIRAVDPNHLISSGVDGMYWPDWRNSYEVWMNINGSRGIDIASSHQYTNDPWSYNWHTERDYIGMVRGQLEAAGRVGKPLFLGEFGAEPRLRAGDENPEIIWYMKAIIREGIRAYGFHWFYPWRRKSLFGLNPDASPRTVEWMRELNAFAREGREVPEGFGPKTVDYPFPICAGAKPFAGPAPQLAGRGELTPCAPNVSANRHASFGVPGEAAPSLRITWKAGRSAAGLDMGPHHPGDLSEYREAGGRLGLLMRSEKVMTGGIRVVVRDRKGRKGAVDIAPFLRVAGTTSWTRLRRGGRLGREWTKVNVPMKRFGGKIDWSNWAGVGLEFLPNTAGCITIDDIEITCAADPG